MHPSARSALAGLMALALLSASTAQAFDNMADTAINNMMLGTHIPPMNQAMMAGVLEADRSSGPDAPAARHSASPSDTGFDARPLDMRREGSATLDSVQQELAQAMTADRAERTRLLGALRSGQVASQFSEQLRHNGMDPDDLADGLTAWIVIMWLIANDQLDGRSDPNRLQAVSDQLGPLFRSSPELRALTPQQRAAEYERIAALSMYGIAAYTRFKHDGDTEAIQRLRSMVQAGMRQAGWDLMSLEITDAGMVAR